MTGLRPESEEALSEMVASASGSLSVRGGHTRGMAPEGGMVLETGGLCGIRLYDPGAMTLVAGAGTPLAEIQQVLVAQGQRLAFEPMDHRALLGTKGAPTLGGVIAGNVSGPRRIQAGAARDFLLGLRFVDGSGTVLSNGGRVMKNVTGLDLARLLAGSRGSLGVITEVSLKVLPCPETAACLLIDGLSDAEALGVMAQALGSPFEVTGVAHVPVGLSGHPVTMLRVEGLEGSVKYRIGQLKEVLNRPCRVESDPVRVEEGWSWIRDLRAFDGLEGDVWKISCRPSQGPALAARIGARALQYDWGGGLVWALVEEGFALRHALGSFDGHATRVRGSGPGALAPEAPGNAALMQGLRARFDPRGLFSAALCVTTPA